MANTMHYPVRSPGKGYALVAGSFQTNGSSAVTLSKGRGFTVARSSTGLFTVTFTDAYPDFVSFGVSLLHASAVTSDVCVRSLSSTGKSMVIALTTENATTGIKALGDLTTARISFWVLFKTVGV